MKKNEEEKYIKKRLRKACLQSIFFYIFRIMPIKKNKIVFCCIEGTTGYSCNPKYIAKVLLDDKPKGKYNLVWLVNDIEKEFPKEINKVKNTLLNRAYHLSTAKIWIDNSRKQLEVRKRKGQFYIQTWHAKLGFKPTCLDRGSSFSRIAYLVSKHDSDLIDYVLSNSKWYDDTLPRGMIYNGPILRTGSPRCDILVNKTIDDIISIKEKYGLRQNTKVLMYAPTFRGGNQSMDRTIQTGNTTIDYNMLIKILEKKFGGEWYIFMRLHPQLVSRNIIEKVENKQIIDISYEDDMYEILSGCDAFMTDYSSAAFDAAVMKIPVFIYADDYKTYQSERGSLLWKMEELPFPMAQNNIELEQIIMGFDDIKYQHELNDLFNKIELLEDGNAAKRVAEKIGEWIVNE